MSETRKIAAILVADVVGYSRLAGADEDRTLARLRGLRSDLIDPAIAAHHGRIVKRTGDGSLIEFRSVVDAVRCAIEVQTGMSERNAGVLEDRRIQFRVGIHLGDVVEEADGDLMGDGVNIAARLEGICAPAAICLSEDAYRQVKGRLDLAVTDLGPTQLKNIAEPIRVYSLQVGAWAKPAAAAEPMAQAKLPERKRRSAFSPLAAALVALLVVIVGGAWWFLNATRPASIVTKAPAEAARLSIVVLPFANLSGDPGQDYLIDALTDELTTRIARLPGSFVIARNTAFTYKGKTIDAKAIGKDLGVRYVLEGSVQLSGAQTRVNAQLIDADSGAHVWAEQFDTPRADLLQMHDEIVTHLARALELQLPEAEAARLKRTPPANPNAEDLALQCEGALHKVGYFGAAADAGYRLCEQALVIDPDNVRALTAFSLKYSLQVAMGGSADSEADLKRADELASHALALEPNWYRPHRYKAFVLSLRNRLEEAIGEEERTLALDPNATEAYAGLGWDYLGLGQFERSLEFFDKSSRLSPLDPQLLYWYNGKSTAYFGLKQYDQAIEWARRSITINPNPNDNAFPHGILIAALGLTGHEADAHEALQRYLALYSTGNLRTIAAWKANLALGSSANPRVLEANDRTIEGLRKAGLPEG